MPGSVAPGEERLAHLQAERLTWSARSLRCPIIARDLASLGFYRLRVKRETAAMEEERVHRERRSANSPPWSKRRNAA